MRLSEKGMKIQDRLKSCYWKRLNWCRKICLRQRMKFTINGESIQSGEDDIMEKSFGTVWLECVGEVWVEDENIREVRGAVMHIKLRKSWRCHRWEEEKLPMNGFVKVYDGIVKWLYAWASDKGSDCFPLHRGTGNKNNCAIVITSLSVHPKSDTINWNISSPNWLSHCNYPLLPWYTFFLSVPSTVLLYIFLTKLLSAIGSTWPGCKNIFLLQ